MSDIAMSVILKKNMTCLKSLEFMKMESLLSLLVGPLPCVGKDGALEIVIYDYFQIVIHVESLIKL